MTANVRPSLVIASVSFQMDDSVIITYMDAVQDERNGGLLVANHQIQVHPGEGGRDYGDEIEDVRDAVKRLLADALNDFVATPPASAGDNERSQDD